MRYGINTRHLRQSGPPTTTNSSLEELYLSTVDFDSVRTDKLCSTQDYVDSVLFAEVFGGVVHSYLSTNLPHALHDLGEVDLDLPTDLKSVILGAMAQFVGY